MNQHTKPPAGGDDNPTPEDRFFGRLAEVVGQMQASAEHAQDIERQIGKNVERYAAFVRRHRLWSLANMIVMGLNLAAICIYLATRWWEVFP